MVRSDELNVPGDSVQEAEVARSDSTMEDEAESSSDGSVEHKVSSPLEGLFSSLAHSMGKVCK